MADLASLEDQKKRSSINKEEMRHKEMHKQHFKKVRMH